MTENIVKKIYYYFFCRNFNKKNLSSEMKKYKKKNFLIFYVEMFLFLCLSLSQKTTQKISFFSKLKLK